MVLLADGSEGGFESGVMVGVLLLYIGKGFLFRLDLGFLKGW